MVHLIVGEAGLESLAQSIAYEKEKACQQLLGEFVDMGTCMSKGDAKPKHVQCNGRRSPGAEEIIVD